MPYNDFEEKVFQLTPSRRATINPAITLATTLFQLTPSRRATSTLPSSSVIPVFQLTPSRRATTLRKSGAWNCEDFNSRPHGGRLLIEREESCRYISTHALTEGDGRGRLPCDAAGHFNSRPHGGRRERRLIHAERIQISTHALTEGDSTEFRPCPGQMHFNSRPHGGRLKPMLGSYSITNFNSRPHGGRPGSINANPLQAAYNKFQLTPSRRATPWKCIRGMVMHITNFNSRPHGGRHIHSFFLLFL